VGTGNDQHCSKQDRKKSGDGLAHRVCRNIAVISLNESCKKHRTRNWRGGRTGGDNDFEMEPDPANIVFDCRPVVGHQLNSNAVNIQGPFRFVRLMTSLGIQAAAYERKYSNEKMFLLWR
jgi:hypothetical protein